MCELPGISNTQPVSAQSFLRAFHRGGDETASAPSLSHGPRLISMGKTADNPDGQGVALRRDGRFSLDNEPLPARNQGFMELTASLHADLPVGQVYRSSAPPVTTSTAVANNRSMNAA